MVDVKDTKICIVGLGYVGLPLAIYFSRHFNIETSGKKIVKLYKRI